jgi:two-component system, sensor histidine kinase and response regulator
LKLETAPTNLSAPSTTPETPSNRVQSSVTPIERITERATTAATIAALQRENQQLKAVIECFPHPLSVKNREGRYEYVSQTWLSLYDLQRTDVIGKTWGELKGDSFATLIAADQVLLNKIGVTKIEHETANTSTTTNKATGILHKASLVQDGVITGVITAITDISDRKAVERKLSMSEERFRSLASLSADWFWELDETLRFTRVTAGIEAATGQPVSFFIGRKFSELPEAVRTIRNNVKIANSFAQRQSFKEERVETAFTADKHAWLSLSGEPMFTAEGRYCGYRGVGRDVTEAHISNLRLLAEKEKSESANKVKTQFLANMSHELRTPLNGVMGMAELLSMTTLDAEQEEYVATLKQSADILLNSVGNILLLTKLVGNSSNTKVAHFNCHDAIKTLTQHTALAAAAKHLFFESNINLPERILHIGNSEVMSKAIGCLLDNAVKFTERGDVHAHFWLGKITDGIVMLEGKITDTGIGIDVTHLTTIFEVFEQADVSNTRRFGGLGLGLPIAKRIFDQAGGSLTVQSVAGHGSTFTFSYPLRLN